MVTPSIFLDPTVTSLAIASDVRGYALREFIRFGSECAVLHAIAVKLVERRSYKVPSRDLLDAAVESKTVSEFTFCNRDVSKHEVVMMIVERIKQYSLADKFRSVRSQVSDSLSPLEKELSIARALLPTDWDLAISFHPDLTFHVNDANCSTVLTGDVNGDFLFTLATAAEEHPSAFDIAA